MAKDEAPPRFIMPGDDPNLDAALARLQKDGEDGDPLYVDFRKRRRERMRQAASGAVREVAAPAPEPVGGGSEVAPPPALEDAPAPAATTDRVVEPQPVELPAPAAQKATPSGTAKGSRSRATPRWLLWAALAITAPVVAIAIGSLWSHHRATSSPTDATSAAVRAIAAPSTPPSVQVKETPTVPTADTVAREPAPAPSVGATVPSATASTGASASAHAPKPHGKRIPVQDDPYIDAAAPTAPTVAPSAPPAPPPVRMQPEDNREF